MCVMDYYVGTKSPKTFQEDPDPSFRKWISKKEDRYLRITCDGPICLLCIYTSFVVVTGNPQIHRSMCLFGHISHIIILTVMSYYLEFSLDMYNSTLVISPRVFSVTLKSFYKDPLFFTNTPFIDLSLLSVPVNFISLVVPFLCGTT